MYYLFKTNPQAPEDAIMKAAYRSLDGVVINGFHVLPVPSQIAIDESDAAQDFLTYGDVISQKYDKMLQTLPTYTGIWYDDLTDPYIDGNASQDILTGAGILQLNGDDSVAQTMPISLGDEYDEVLVYVSTSVRDSSTAGGQGPMSLNQTSYEAVDASQALTVNLLANELPNGLQPDVNILSRIPLSSGVEDITLQFEHNHTADIAIRIDAVALLYSKSQE